MRETQLTEPSLTLLIWIPVLLISLLRIQITQHKNTLMNYLLAGTPILKKCSLCVTHGYNHIIALVLTL